MRLLKGNFIYSIDKNEIEIKENQYLLVKDGKVEGFYNEVPSIAKDVNADITDTQISAIIGTLHSCHKFCHCICSFI